MFRFCNLVFASRFLFHTFKSVRHTGNIFKLGRLLPSSGCVIAGCCFSRQPDEEAILDDVKNNQEDFPIIEKKGSLHSDSNFKHLSNSKDMKRSFEYITDTTLQNTDIYEDPLRKLDVKSKRKRTDLSKIVGDESFQQELLDTVSDSSTHVCTEPQAARFEKPKVETEKPKRHRPNYFVAVKISDGQIHRTLSELQAQILQKDKRLQKCMIELKTLHITLMVMYIGDTETHARAMKALENIHQEHDEDMSKNPVKLEFQGLGHFQNRVLFAKLSTDDSYQRLCLLTESVKKHFEAASIFSTDSRQGFTPHLTVAKIDFTKKHNRFIKKIDPVCYQDFNNQYFGSQKVVSIQLLSMLGPKNEAGYYSGDEIYFRAFNPTAKHNSLSKMLGTEEKKKNVKEMINVLMKEKLK